MEENIRSTGMLATFLEVISFNLYSHFGCKSADELSRIKTLKCYKSYETKFSHNSNTKWWLMMTELTSLSCCAFILA